MFTVFNTALSGLSANSTAIDIVGNNLANLNTTGYKADAVEFQDLMSQQLGTASTGQVGLGVGSAGLANRRPSISWASPSSAASPAGASSCSCVRHAGIECGRSSRKSRRRCDDEDTSRSPNKGLGWGKS